MAHFELQPEEKDLEKLAGQCWRNQGEREHQLEAEAYAAGASIRAGEYSLANLEAIVRWKSERVVYYLIGNGQAKIKEALRVVAAPEVSVRKAVETLTELRGVDLAIASAILATIWPERFNVLDYRTLEALGHARKDVEFYAEYVEFCKRLAEKGLVKPQEDLPGPTKLHALERGLWEWARARVENKVSA